MSGFLAENGQWVQSLMHSLGYGGMAFVLFLQNTFSPVPSELVLPLAGALMSEGRLALIVLILAATRAFAELREAGAVEQRRRRIHVVDMEALERAAIG